MPAASDHAVSVYYSIPFILILVLPAFEQGKASIFHLYATSIAPCCHIIAAKLFAALLQQRKLQMPVAGNARVGRFTLQIRTTKRFNNIRTEML